MSASRGDVADRRGARLALHLELEAPTLIQLRAKVLRVSALLHEMAYGKRSIPEIREALRAAGAEVKAQPANDVNNAGGR